MDRVTGADGRVWTVRSEMEWRAPATADDFEQDIAGGHFAAAIMIVIIGVFVAVLLVWLPDEVIVPNWVLLILLLIALFFPTRWVLRRPWKVVAETAGNRTDEQPPERWVGTVRGVFHVRGEIHEIKLAIRKFSTPSIDGPLRPVE